MLTLAEMCHNMLIKQLLHQNTEIALRVVFVDNNNGQML